VNQTFPHIIVAVPSDRNSLPKDPAILQQMLIDLTTQLDKTRRLLRQLLEAKHSTKSEQLSPDQLQLFIAELNRSKAASKDDDQLPPPDAGSGQAEGQENSRTRGRRPPPPHLKRQRIEHDLTAEEKHCAGCQQDLHLIGEETSERYEYIPAQFIVIEDVCKKYACACTIKTATKPPLPIAKSSAERRYWRKSSSAKSPIMCRCIGKGKFFRAAASTLRTRRWADGCGNPESCSNHSMPD
jgi:hypothetical protein